MCPYLLQSGRCSRSDPWQLQGCPGSDDSLLVTPIAWNQVSDLSPFSHLISLHHSLNAFASDKMPCRGPVCFHFLLGSHGPLAQCPFLLSRPSKRLISDISDLKNQNVFWLEETSPLWLDLFLHIRTHHLLPYVLVSLVCLYFPSISEPCGQGSGPFTFVDGFPHRSWYLLVTQKRGAKWGFSKTLETTKYKSLLTSLLGNHL